MKKCADQSPRIFHYLAISGKEPRGATASILRRACNEWEWTERVPKFKMFKEAEGRVRSLTPQEFERLRRELPPHLADMAVLSVATGLRQANVKGLEWQYVDLERRHAWIPGSKHKNGKPHSVPLNEMALAVLRKQIGQHPTRVFTYQGKAIEQVATRAWRTALERAGIQNFRWHDLRHTFATWHRQAGTPTHELQKLSGWKTGAMVERYAHVAPEALQGAANRLDAFSSYDLFGYATKPNGLGDVPKPLNYLAPRPGLEPGTCGLTVRRSTD